MSAAVIGRQLRQQQNTSSRTSGPLVPPASIYKGRPRTPSQIGRPYSPAATSSTFGTGTIHTGSTGGVGGVGGVSVINYPHAHSTQSNRSTDQLSKHNYSTLQNYTNSKNKSSDNQATANDDEPRIRCTCHCFCIALKALSLGLCLLIAGVIMSGFGFYNEHYFMLQHTNLTAITETEKASLTMYRNLTYAGPVIMGLGGIMIVAALVLTFEVRDTLGVKVAPVKQQQQKQQQQLNLSSIGQSASSQVPVIPSMHQQQSLPSGRKNTITSVSSTVALVPLVHLTPLKSNSAADVAGASAKNSVTGSTAAASNHHSQGYQHRGETIMELETTLTEPTTASNTATTTTTDDRGEVGAVTRPSACQVRTYKNLLSSVHSSNDYKYCKNDENYNIFTTSSSSETNSLTNLTLGDNDMGYLDFISSPQDTEISDPEGCSIIINTQGNSSTSVETGIAVAPSISSLASSSIESTPGVCIQSIDLTYDKLTKSTNRTNKWRAGRCSCSASPSNSIDAIDTLDLIFLTENTKQKITDELFEEHLLQQRVLLQEQLLLEQQKQQLKLQERLLYGKKLQLYQQPQRTIAFIESDGLSSTSTSSENLFTKNVKCKSAPAYNERRSRLFTATATVTPPTAVTATASTSSACDNLNDDSLTVPLLDVPREESINEDSQLFPLLKKQPLGY